MDWGESIEITDTKTLVIHLFILLFVGWQGRSLGKIVNFIDLEKHLT